MLAAAELTCEGSGHEAPRVLRLPLHPVVQVRPGVLRGLHAVHHVQACQAGTAPSAAAAAEEELEMPMVVL